MKKIWIYDIETWRNFHSNTFVNPEDKSEFKQFVISPYRNDIEEYYKFLKEEVAGLIGFNNVNYDYPLLHYILVQKNKYIKEDPLSVTRQLYEKSKDIIEDPFSRINGKLVMIPQLDLYLIHHFDNKNKATSLKYVEINTRFENVEDLPFDENYTVRKEDIPEILLYNMNDVLATLHFYNLSKGDINLRKELRKQFKFKIDFLNFNDPKMGSEIFAKILSKELSIPIYELKQMRTHRNNIHLGSIILPNIKFQSTEFNNLLDKFKNTVINETKDPFNYSVIYKGFKYDYGVGGLHGCIEPGIYKADDKIIYDIDIDGMYPKTAIVNKFYPEHLGEQFYKIYEDVYNQRMAAKKDYKLDKTNSSASAINSGLKLVLYGVYGKSNDKYSYFYDPKFAMQVTVNGQLFLSMLAEAICNIFSVEMLQVNTDGISIKISPEDREEFLAICDAWEIVTGYTLEYNTYKQMIIRDVNNYIAEYVENYEPKYKGCFEIIPMQNGKIAYNKNFSMRIVPKALSEYYLKGIPVEETIRNHKDIYDFCLAAKFPGKWQGKWIDFNNHIPQDIIFKKTLRYYISTKGNYLWKVNIEDGRIHQLNVGYSVIPFNKFENKENYNINYNFYIAEANKIINTINDGQLKLPWY